MSDRIKKLFPVILIALAALLFATLATVQKANKNLKALRGELAESGRKVEALELALHDEKETVADLRKRLKLIFEKLAENPKKTTLENVEFHLGTAGEEVGEEQEGEVLRVLKKRLETMGKYPSRSEFDGNGKLVVRIPLVDKSEVVHILRVLEARGTVKFRFVATEKEMAGHDEGAEGFAWMDYFDGTGERELIRIEDEWNFGGELLSAVYPAANGMIGFDVKPEKQEAFFECTKANSEAKLLRGRRMAVILDDKILSAPTLRDGITTQGVITPGMEGFKPGERKRVIALLGSGELPVRLVFEDMKFAERVENGHKPERSTERETKLRTALIRVIRAFRKPKTDPMSDLFHPKLLAAMSEKQAKFHEKSVFATSDFYRNFPVDWETKLKAKYRVVPSGLYILSREVENVLGEAHDLYEVRFEPLGGRVQFAYHTHTFVLTGDEFKLAHPLTPEKLIDDMENGAARPNPEADPFLKKMADSKKELEGIEWKEL